MSKPNSQLGDLALVPLDLGGKKSKDRNSAVKANKAYSRAAGGDAGGLPSVVRQGAADYPPKGGRPKPLAPVYLMMDAEGNVEDVTLPRIDSSPSYASQMGWAGQSPHYSPSHAKHSRTTGLEVPGSPGPTPLARTSMDQAAAGGSEGPSRGKRTGEALPMPAPGPPPGAPPANGRRPAPDMCSSPTGWGGDSTTHTLKPWLQPLGAQQYGGNMERRPDRIPDAVALLQQMQQQQQQQQQQQPPGSVGPGAEEALPKGLKAPQFDPSDYLDVLNPPPLLQNIPRRSLLVKIPVLTVNFSVDLPVFLEDRHGSACLIVLPSDKPSSRAEALAVEQLLGEMTREPGKAAARAAQWRSQLLATLCTEAVAALYESVRVRRHGSGGPQGPSSWMFRTLQRSMTPMVQSLGLQQGLEEEPSSFSRTSVNSTSNNGDNVTTASAMKFNNKGTISSISSAIASELNLDLRKPIRQSSFSGPFNRGNYAGGSPNNSSSNNIVHPLATTTTITSVSATTSPQRTRPGEAAEQGGVASHATAYVVPMSGASAESAAAVASAHAVLQQSVDRVAQSQQTMMDAMSLSIGVTVCMADIIRQVEVQCGERGRALASVWNTFLGNHEGVMRSLRKSNLELTKDNERVRSELSSLASQVDNLEFLRREVVRFRGEAAQHSAEASSLLAETLALRERNEYAEAQLAAVQAAVRNRLARLRWQHAYALIGTRRRKTTIKGGSSVPRPDSSKLTRRNALAEDTQYLVDCMAMSERLVAARVHADKRAKAFGRKRNKRDYEVDHSAAVQEALTKYIEEQIKAQAAQQAQQQQQQDQDQEQQALSARRSPSRWGSQRSMHMGASGAQLINGLTPEAQIMVMTTMTEAQRLEMLRGMSDEDRAQMVVMMNRDMRDSVHKGLGVEVWGKTMELIKNSPLAARLLAGMDTNEAVAEFRTWAISQQKDALEALDSATAGSILQNLDAHVRQELLRRIESHVSANIVQALPPPPAAVIVNELDEQRAIQVLMAMDPTRAAEVLVTMGLDKAVAKLANSEMESEARVNILESMQPKQAAAMVVEIDRAVEADGSHVTFGANQVRRIPRKSEESEDLWGGGPGSSSLSEMATESAGNIMSYMSVKDKAGVMSSMDPSKVAEILGQMEASEAVLLLSTLSDYQASAVSEALSSEDRGNLMKVLEAGARKAAAKGKNGGEGGGEGNGRSASGKGHGSKPGGGKVANAKKKDGPKLEKVQRLTAHYDAYGEQLMNPDEDAVPADDSGWESSDGRRGSPGPGEVGGHSPRQSFVNEVIKHSGSFNARSSTAGTVVEAPPSATSALELVVEEDVELGGEPGSGEGGRHRHVGVQVGGGGGGLTPGKLHVLVDDEDLQSVPGAEGALPTKPRGSRASGLGKPGANQRPGERRSRTSAINMATNLFKQNLKEKQEQDVRGGPPPALKAKMPDGNNVDQVSKLGRVPKNQRLADAIQMHRNAKPKPKGWLMAVVEAIHKDGETTLRKLGRAEAIRKMSVPEIVFGYFHNKYGQKALVDEYVGALVNTLTLYRASDLRLEAFARFLSEEWDFATFLDFLVAQNMALQPVKVVCVEYPRDPAKDEQYAWIDLVKAVYIADVMLGARTEPVRDKLLEFVQAACVQVEEAEMVQLRRDPRLAGETLPDVLYKLPRIRFLLILCKELARINQLITKLANDKFTTLDMDHSDVIPASAVRQYLAMVLGKELTPDMAEALHLDFVTVAHSKAANVPADQVDVELVSSVHRDGFVAASLLCDPIREHVKLKMLQPARGEDDEDESQIFKSFMLVLVHRHRRAVVPHLEGWLGGAQGSPGGSPPPGAAARLAELLSGVDKAATGDAKIKAYLSMLLGLINLQVQTLIQHLAGGDLEMSAVDDAVVEQQLCLLEDVVIMMMHSNKHIMDSGQAGVEMDLIRRLPYKARVPYVGQQLRLIKQLQLMLQHGAAFVVQDIWRRRQQHKRAMQQAASGADRNDTSQTPKLTPRLAFPAAPSPELMEDAEKIKRQIIAGGQPGQGDFTI